MGEGGGQQTLALSFEDTLKDCQKLDVELRAFFRERSECFDDACLLLAMYRAGCGDLLLQDPVKANEHRVEERLWEAHCLIHKSFEKQLSIHASSHGGQKVIERRNSSKVFVRFIKNAQCFYRAQIRCLAESAGGVPELKETADISVPSSNRRESTQEDSPRQRVALIMTYQALIRLGDLSRWRETALQGTSDRNWAPAFGYYDLASRIQPSTGTAFHQMAVLAQLQGDKLDVVYYLYRALSVECPHRSALQNLKMNLGQQLKDHAHHPSSSQNASFIGRILNLHALILLGPEYVGAPELENEVIKLLELVARKPAMFDSISKVVLMNIAAEDLIRREIQSGSASATMFGSLISCMQLNLRTFAVLLKLGLDEINAVLRKQTALDKDRQVAPMKHVKKSFFGLMLWIRQYSGWLVTQKAILASDTDDKSLDLHSWNLGKVYSEVLNILCTHFTTENNVSIQYLLDEDADVLGFLPLHNEGERMRQRYLESGGSRIKRRAPSSHGEMRTWEELVARIEDILADGIHLQLQQESCITIEGGVFRFTRLRPDAMLESSDVDVASSILPKHG